MGCCASASVVPKQGAEERAGRTNETYARSVVRPQSNTRISQQGAEELPGQNEKHAEQSVAKPKSNTRLSKQATGEPSSGNKQHADQSFARPQSSTRISKQAAGEPHDKNRDHGDKTGAKHRSQEQSQTQITISKRIEKPDPIVFQRVDEHALQAPTQIKSSVANVAEYLRRGAKTEMELARIVYRWISNNISYDTESYFGGTTTSEKCDPETVLARGMSVCSGYSNIYAKLCSLLGVETVIISGFAKGFGYSAGDAYKTTDATNHAWNAVKIDGQWRLLDSTWGTGHINTQNVFTWGFNEHYFLTDPNAFVNNHFPVNEKGSSSNWQLLEKPLSLDRYNEMPSVTSHFFVHGMKLLSHDCNTITINKEVDIEFSSQSTMFQIFNLRGSDSGESMERYGYLSRVNNLTTKIHVQPPKPGKYTLEIFGKDNDDKTSTNNSLFKYIIVCTSTKTSLAPYPENKQILGPTAEFHAMRLSLNNPFQGYITSSDGKAALDINAPKNVSIMCSLNSGSAPDRDLTDYTMIQKSTSGYLVNMSLPESCFYKLTIFAKHSDASGSFNFMAYFLINCKKTGPSVTPFPKLGQTWGTNDRFTDLGLSLDNPLLSRIVSSDGCVALPISMTTDANIMCHLNHCNMDDNNRSLDAYTMVEMSRKGITVHMRLKEAGFHKLTLFGKRSSDEGSYNHLAYILIDCSKAFKSCQPFPHIYPLKQGMVYTIVEPLERDLKANSDVHFKVTSPDLKKIMIMKELLAQTGPETWEGVVQMPNSGEKVTVYGNKGEGSFSGLVKYGTI